MCHAVLTHHALNLDCLFHNIFLLFMCRKRLFAAYGQNSRRPRRFSLSCAEKAQAQRVRDHADGRQAHCRRANHRTELDAERHPQQTRRNRNADAVVEERPEQVLANVAHGPARQPDGVHRVHQVALHQHNVRRRDSHVRARTNRNAAIGTRKRRCIVDAVANHGNLAALALLLAHDTLLVLREHLSDHIGHAQLGCDGLRGFLVVAGEQRYVNVHTAQCFDCRLAGRLEHISDRKNADNLTVCREEQRRFACCGKLIAQLLH